MFRILAAVAGRLDVVMQIPLHTASSAEDYVAKQEWRDVRLECCPLHPLGGCAFARHGSYARVVPNAMRIARWYCPQGHQTFSLLPDFLAARMPGLLSAVEQAVATAEASRGLEVAADQLRSDAVTLPSAMRWLRRRVRAVYQALKPACGLIPELPKSDRPSVLALRVHLGVDQVLLWLRRTLAANALVTISAPLGLRAYRSVANVRCDAGQHEVGPDGVMGARYVGANTKPEPPCDTSPRDRTKPKRYRRRQRSSAPGVPIAV
jgi:hypothetical protein